MSFVVNNKADEEKIEPGLVYDERKPHVVDVHLLKTSEDVIMAEPKEGSYPREHPVAYSLWFAGEPQDC